MRVFSRDKYIEAEGFSNYLKNNVWVDDLDGLDVVEVRKAGYFSYPEWEIEV